MSGNPELPSHPAPPPGFADDNNQFYLTEEMDTLNINSAPVTGKTLQNDSEKIQDLSCRQKLVCFRSQLLITQLKLELTRFVLIFIS